MSTSVSDERDASRDSGPAPEEPVVVSANDARQGLPAATCSSSWDLGPPARFSRSRRFWLVSSCFDHGVEQASRLGGASANYVTSPLYQIADRGQTGFAPICIRGGCDCAHCRHLDTRCPHMPCRNSAGSVDVRNRRRRGIVYCGRTFAVFVHQGRPRDVSSVKTSSRDDLRRAPVFAGVRRRSRSDRAPSAADAVCDVPANSCRKNWELTE